MTKLLAPFSEQYSILLFCGHYLTLLAIKIDTYNNYHSWYVYLSIAEFIVVPLLCFLYYRSNNFISRVLLGVYMAIVSVLILPKNISNIKIGTTYDTISYFAVVGYGYFLISGLLLVRRSLHRGKGYSIKETTN